MQATHISSAKNINVFAIFQDRIFNVALTNNYVILTVYVFPEDTISHAAQLYINARKHVLNVYDTLSVIL